MSEPHSREELIRRIHAATGQMVLVITGGGSRAISDLLAVPGGFANNFRSRRPLFGSRTHRFPARSAGTFLLGTRCPIHGHGRL